MSTDSAPIYRSRQGVEVFAGQEFGRLAILDVTTVPVAGKNRTMFVCRCSCGNAATIRTDSILRERKPTRSCGCYGYYDAPKVSRKHGGWKTSEYRVWSKMKDRCSNPNSDSYEDYGGRGITVCPQWIDSFEQFLKDMGPRPSLAYTLEREDNSKGYSPENCVWATRKQQQNNRRDCRYIEHRGLRLTVTQWSEQTGLHVSTIKHRLSRGLSPEEALETPVAPGASRRWRHPIPAM